MFGKLSFSVGLVLILLVGLLANTAGATTPNVRWSTPKQIPGYPSQTEPPLLVSDNNKTVHAFHVQPVNDRPAIVYSTWARSRGWTLPVDILLPPRAGYSIVLNGIFLDTKGNLHLIFVAGDPLYGGDVYYARVAVIDAGRAWAWTKPIIVAQNVRLLANMASLTGDAQGNLYLFYSGSKNGNGLYEIFSKDGGDTWSDSLAIFRTNDDYTYPGDIALLVGKGEVHIAWSVLRPPYGGEQLYYARLDTERARVSIPILQSRPITGNFTLPGAPSMIMHNDVLFLIYQEITDLANGSMVKLMRQSTDHGKSWSKPMWAFPPLVGGNGAATLLIDSNNQLQAVLANRTDDCCHGMWYALWQKDRWSESQAIIDPGPKTRMFDPQIPQAVISQGNVILATWIQEEKLNGVWYSYAKLDTPELSVEPLPLPTPIPSPRSIASDTTSTLTPTEPRPTRTTVTTTLTDIPAVTESSPNLSIVIGVLPALMLIVLIGLWRARR